MNAPKLRTIDREGNAHVFELQLTRQSVPCNKWNYHIKHPESHDFYQGDFTEIGNGKIQPEMLTNQYLPEYKGRGITEALFADVTQKSGLTLVSSTNRGTKNFENESRSHPADKVWKRLVASGKATYDIEEDRYTYTG